MSVRMVALDPATHTGYSWLDIPVPVPPGLKPLRCQSGVFDFSVKRHEGGGMRFLRAKKALMEMEPDFVLYEEVRRHKGTSAAQIYGGLIAIIQSYCTEKGITYVGVPVGTIKKRATGKGTSGKDMMIDAANAEFVREGDETISDDNIADAMWLLQIGLEEYGAVLAEGASHEEK